MAAITRRLLHLRPDFHSYARTHLCPLRHFSSSSDPDPVTSQLDSNSEAQTLPLSSSTSGEVGASFQQQDPSQNRRQVSRTPPASRGNANDEIRRHLSEFQIRSSAQPLSSDGLGVSLQELYERHKGSNGEGPAGFSGSNPGLKHSADAVRSSLLGSQNDLGGRFSLSRMAEKLKLKADANANLGAGNQGFMSPFYQKEARGKGNSNISSMEFRNMMISHLDLGKKLKTLRPENRRGKWFSLQELSDRLVKLRDAEKKEKEAKPQSIAEHLKDAIRGIPNLEVEKEQKRLMQRLVFVNTKSTELLSPKNNLVEKYFHPDNMSSAEKLKLELKKVRDEFKMSESDCGSTRVQVVQLTLKIKHLSAVLQKKDKHSRRGLLSMVQRRKRLLKYLRENDWDSYCLVLSKLGLRDNPVKA